MFELIGPFETKRLRIKLLEMRDVPALQRLTDDPVITISFLPKPFKLDDAEALVRGIDDGRHRFAGLWRDDTLVGVLGVFVHDDSHLEVGYWIGSAFQGNGYATEALTGAVLIFRSIFPAHSILAECSPANERSRSVLKKAGFQLTGELGHRTGMELYRVR